MKRDMPHTFIYWSAIALLAIVALVVPLCVSCASIGDSEFCVTIDGKRFCAVYNTQTKKVSFKGDVELSEEDLDELRERVKALGK